MNQLLLELIKCDVVERTIIHYILNLVLILLLVSIQESVRSLVLERKLKLMQEHMSKKKGLQNHLLKGQIFLFKVLIYILNFVQAQIAEPVEIMLN